MIYFMYLQGIAIACVVLYEVVGDLSKRPLIVCGTIVGYTIICAVLLIGEYLKNKK